MGDGAEVARKVADTMKKVSQSMERGVETAVGNVKESAGKLKDRVSKPKMVDLKGTSGYDLLLDMDGRRSADPETLLTIDRETHSKVKKVTEGLTSSLQVLANEPSLGLYRMEEHVLKAVPELVKTKQDIAKLTAIVQGTCHDVEYALTTVQQMHQISSFESLQAHTENAIRFQQEIRRRQAKKAAAAVDSPDLIEPTGAFSTSLRTGMTPTGENEADNAESMSTNNPSADDSGAAHSIKREDDHNPAGDGVGENLSTPKKKKKKKAKEIVAKTF
mmetsp:Transcript_35907/g.94125  ORF Transcript_35907/g.94125 Transcript_35907/m.94125 type:complete len:275 (+) Transcript_35907:297-1121(+)